ncbi:MAG: 50S ribosomal protein L11 methyltransferase [bacterium]|nr:50S ribosomal protein L11 methyltransferase [bacterium]
MSEQLSGNEAVDVTNIFEAAHLPVVGRVVIQQKKGMYPHKRKLEDNWSHYTASCFARLNKRGVHPKIIGIVGIGSGVEAIAAGLAFDSLERVIISDVDTGVVEGAKDNIRNNFSEPKFTLESLVGSFCEPFTEQRLHADLIHANIPNLPAAKGADLSGGAEKGTFLRPELYEGYNPPAKYIEWALGAQYAYLQSAKEALTKGGSVLAEVGGRVPLSLLKDLFTDNGFSFEEALVGFKEQTEAEMDFRGYHAFEREYGLAFDFYRYRHALGALRQYGVTGNIVDMSGKELKELLAPYKVDAGKAFELCRIGSPIGHTVHILKGTKK